MNGTSTSAGSRRPATERTETSRRAAMPVPALRRSVQGTARPTPVQTILLCVRRVARTRYWPLQQACRSERPRIVHGSRRNAFSPFDSWMGSPIAIDQTPGLAWKNGRLVKSRV